MTSTTSEMASLDSSMPPRTHCSAATSCGGIRSNSSPRCVTSARLTERHLPLKLQACNPFVRHSLTEGSDILAGRGTGGQHAPVDNLSRSGRLTCAHSGDFPVDPPRTSPTESVTCCGDRIHRVCRRKSRQVFPQSYPQQNPQAPSGILWKTAAAWRLAGLFPYPERTVAPRARFLP